VARVKKLGDLWKPVVAGKKRYDLRSIFEPPKKKKTTRGKNSGA
jgi:hypothetical protein